MNIEQLFTVIHLVFLMCAVLLYITHLVVFLYKQNYEKARLETINNEAHVVNFPLSMNVYYDHISIIPQAVYTKSF